MTPPLPVLDQHSDPSRGTSGPSVWGPRLDALRVRFRRPGRWVVCFSGGVDSALVLKVAVEERGADVLALTALSPTLPDRERDDCVRIARLLGARHRLVRSEELGNPDFVRNPTNRCYHCKDELYTVARREARRLGYDWIADGVNVSDLGDHRPGLLAAEEHDVLHPLVDAGLDKPDVRGAARALGLDVWDKPAFACLSSRFPYGTPITEVGLTRVERLEFFLRDQGFRTVRVRAHGDAARIEVLPVRIPLLGEEPLRSAVIEVAAAAGFSGVSVDLRGYRQGSLNEGLDLS